MTALNAAFSKKMLDGILVSVDANWRRAQSLVFTDIVMVEIGVN